MNGDPLLISSLNEQMSRVQCGDNVRRGASCYSLSSERRCSILQYVVAKDGVELPITCFQVEAPPYKFYQYYRMFYITPIFYKKINLNFALKYRVRKNSSFYSPANVYIASTQLENPKNYV